MNLVRRMAFFCSLKSTRAGFSIVWRMLGIALFSSLVVGDRVRAVDFPPVDNLRSHPGLPDPLVMLNGERVASREQWFARRRPELRALFQHYMYGYLPPPTKVTAIIEREDRKYFGGKATKKEIALSMGGSD